MRRAAALAVLTALAPLTMAASCRKAPPENPLAPEDIPPELPPDELPEPDPPEPGPGPGPAPGPG